jgi:hypothetical protein
MAWLPFYDYGGFIAGLFILSMILYARNSKYKYWSLSSLLGALTSNLICWVFFEFNYFYPFDLPDPSLVFWFWLFIAIFSSLAHYSLFVITGYIRFKPLRELFKEE